VSVFPASRFALHARIWIDNGELPISAWDELDALLRFLWVPSNQAKIMMRAALLTHSLAATKLPARFLRSGCDILPSAPEEADSNAVSTPKNGRITFSLSSTMESVGEVEAAAEKLAEQAGIDEEERFRVTMAVREAAVNAVLHGNEYDPAKKITVSLENTGAALVFKIADQGRGLVPEAIPDPLAPENLLRGTGRGIFLIRSFMDEVHFRQLHPGTELTLVKNLAVAGEKA
jgi:serine/threonine-protein kinase RsbW